MDIHKFKLWRLAKMSTFAPLASQMHFHRVDDINYMKVENFLRALLIARVDIGTRFTITVPDSVANSILDFIEQMKFGYMHPRSDSAKWLFVQEERAAARAAQNRTATPSFVINLSH